MPNSIAEAYLLILRSSMVPVIGEAVPSPFIGQIELDEWHWELKYDEKANDGKGGTTSPTAQTEANKPAFRGDQLIREVKRLQTEGTMKQEDRNLKVRLAIQKASDAQEKADKAATDDDGTGEKDNDDGKLTFTFKKNMDLASTQLLNSMKSGERMPRAVLTLYHRSTNAPVTLVVTFGNVVLTKYELSSTNPNEAMTEMVESWTAIYETVDYVYQNRPAASGPNGVTKGTARVFKMKLKSLF
ncbi:MAG: type VI secretion system tube protein Hcp [Caldimonas sp.]